MKKNVKIAGIVVLALIVIILIVLVASQKTSKPNQQAGTSTSVPKEMAQTQTPEAAKATQALINDVVEGTDQKPQTIQVGQTTGEGDNATTTFKEVKTVVVSPGTNGIDINTGKVVTKTGEVAANNAQAGTGQAPQQSFPIEKTSLPKSTIKLDVTSNSFTPNTFTVNRGQAVNLAVSNVNSTTFSEVFRFDDASLSAVVLGLAKGETKSITFNAPDKAGEYTFYSSMFDHRAQGAVGKMIVK